MVQTGVGMPEMWQKSYLERKTKLACMHILKMKTNVYWRGQYNK